MLLKDKVALITGASTGIGRATASLFAEQGASVIVADINDADGKLTVEGIGKKGGEALYIHADVGVMDQVQAMIQEGIRNYGSIDIVHSNAYASVFGVAHEISEADWDRDPGGQFKSNLDDSALHLTGNAEVAAWWSFYYYRVCPFNSSLCS